MLRYLTNGNVKSSVDNGNSWDCKNSVDSARFKPMDILATVFFFTLLLLIIMEIPVTIYTQNTLLQFDLFEESRVKTGMEKQIADGLSVRFEYSRVHGAVDFSTIFQLTFVVASHISEGVVIGLITTWLLKKLDKKEAKVTKLVIDKVSVELDESKIKKIIHEKIRKTG
jgi:hypothetical protein